MSNDIGFNLSGLDIDALIEQSKKQSTSRTGSVAWMPEGTHEMRVILDKDKNLLREVRVHNIDGLRVPCNKHLTANGIKDENGHELPKCELCELSYSGDLWKNKPTSHYLYYVHVYSTSVSGDAAKYFKAGETYVLIANSKFKKGFSDFIEKISAKDKKFLLESINPYSEGKAFEVTVKRGTDGSVNISHCFDPKPMPVVPKLETSWGSLETAWMPNVYDAQKYEEAVLKMREIFATHMKYVVDNPTSFADKDVAKVAYSYFNRLNSGTIIEHEAVVPQLTQQEPIAQPIVQQPQATALQAKLESALPDLGQASTTGAKIVFVPATEASRKAGTVSPCFGNHCDEPACVVCDSAIECAESQYNK